MSPYKEQDKENNRRIISPYKEQEKESDIENRGLYIVYHQTAWQTTSSLKLLKRKLRMAT